MAAKAAYSKQEHDYLMARAVKAYQAELKKPYHGRHGLCTICKDFEQLYYEEMGVCIPLIFATLGQLADGGNTRAKANENRCWLTPIEEEVIATFSIEIGTRGFGLSHHHLKEHVDCIACARLGDKFPASGVGKNWTTRFMAQVLRFHPQHVQFHFYLFILQISLEQHAMNACSSIFTFFHA